VASILATVTMAVVLSAVIFLPRSFALAGGVTFHGWQQDRRLWSSLAIGSLLMWVGGVTGGVFDGLSEPAMAESFSVLLMITTGVWWLTLCRGRSPADSSRPMGGEDAQAPLRSFSSSQARPSMSNRPNGPSAEDQARTGSPPPGWYADPWHQAEARRWNGLEWTTDTGPMPGQ
jgi:hypothetical protein